MQIDLEKINRLPPDVRDRFKKILVKYKEEDRQEAAQKRSKFAESVIDGMSEFGIEKHIEDETI